MTASETTEGVDTTWLNPDQLAAWRGFMNLLQRLPAELDLQLKQDSQLSFLEYYVLALLSDEPTRRLRMSELALKVNAELSRLSHLVGRLERRNFVRREPDPDDGRYTLAILTDSGFAHLRAAAPKHVARVRELFIDALSERDLQSLRRSAAKVLARIDAR